MRHHVRPLRPLRVAVLALAAAAALVLALPGAATWAAWRAQDTLEGALGSGALRVDAVGAGAWTTESGAPFDPATARLEPGRTVLYRTTVDVTAVGDNLRATLVTDVAAALPADLAGRVTVTSDDVAVVGAPTPQRVPVTVRVTAGTALPVGDRSFALRLDLLLTNGHGWRSTAARDLGTLTTRGPAAAAELRMLYDLTKGTDRTVVIHVDDVRATVEWVEGQGAVPLVPGRNEHVYPAGTSAATVLVRGFVGSLGSPTQTVDDMRELVHVSNWQEGVGTYDASYAFHNAVNLVRVDGMPSTVRTTAHMFSNARTLRQDFPGAMFANVESMSHMFAGATSFTGYVGGWDTSEVRDMSGMFAGATSFNSWIGGWDTSRVENMTDMFRGATAMAQSVAGWDVGNVTAWDGFNADAPRLTSDLIPPRFRGADAADRASDDGAPGVDLVAPAPPVEPVEPVAPLDPAAPGEPVDPAAPVEPLDPVPPLEPVDPLPAPHHPIASRDEETDR